MHLSYAAPFMNAVRVIFTDGFLSLDDGKVCEFSPRDTFDDSHRFTEPPVQELCSFASTKAYFDDSIEASPSHFLETVLRGGQFQGDALEKAIRSAELILENCDGLWNAVLTNH